MNRTRNSTLMRARDAGFKPNGRQVQKHVPELSEKYQTRFVWVPDQERGNTRGNGGDTRPPPTLGARFAKVAIFQRW
jgi:hypothetical protein